MPEWSTDDEIGFATTIVGMRRRVLGQWQPCSIRQRIARLKWYERMLSVRHYDPGVDVAQVRHATWTLIKFLQEKLDDDREMGLPT